MSNIDKFNAILAIFSMSSLINAHNCFDINRMHALPGGENIAVCISTLTQDQNVLL